MDVRRHYLRGQGFQYAELIDRDAQNNPRYRRFSDEAATVVTQTRAPTADELDMFLADEAEQKTLQQSTRIRGAINQLNTLQTNMNAVAGTSGNLTQAQIKSVATGVANLADFLQDFIRWVGNRVQ